MTNVDRLLAVFHRDPTLWETLEGWDTIRARLRAEIEVWQMSEEDREGAWGAFLKWRIATAPEASQASAPATDA